MKMISLENKEWKDFKIDSLFSVDKGIYIKQSNIENGKIPYITAKAINNGLNCFIGNNNLFEGNNITVEKVKLSAFYQPSKYYCSHDVSVLSNNKLNKENSLFIATMIGRQGSKYSYGRQAQMNVVKRETLFCPINEKNEPDYEYMENYTKSIMDKKVEIYKKYIQNILAGLEYKEILPLNQKKIKPFKVEEIFLIENCKCSKAGALKKGNIPYIGATNRNNGLMGFVKKEEKLLTKGNCMVFICDGQGSVGYSMYKSENFIGSTTLKVGRNERLNKYIGFFLSTLLDMNKSLYDYGYKRSEKRLKKEQIMIPVDEKNEPDFEYMEQYMKNITYKKINQYLNYLEKKN